MNPIADLRLQLLRCGAKRKSSVHVSIGAPQPDDDDWYCPIRLKGLIDNKEQRIFGVDSWQAIILAICYVQATLKNEVRKGGKFYYLDRVTSVEKLFATRLLK